MREENYTYFQYDEIGNPLFYIEFEGNTYFTLYETSFFSDKTEVFFERAIDYAQKSVIEDYPFDRKHFFELLEQDCQRYIVYENPINFDFIDTRYLNGKNVNFHLLKTEIYITKKLQRGGVFRNLDYANVIVSTCLNILGKEKFEHQFCSLTPIHKLHFFSHVFEFVTENRIMCFSEFTTDNYVVCSIGAYDIYCYEDEKGVFSCWLKEVKQD